VIARLRGVLAERSADGVVVDCGGVGYDVGVSVNTLAALPDVGADVTLRVFTHAQENKIRLYGFATLEERQLFDLLITVKNVGPATAIAILSGAAPEPLARVVADGNLRELTRIKGVGKKTAELMVVELKEKCAYLLATWYAGQAGQAGGGNGAALSPHAVSSGSRPPILDDVASALVNLGWRAAEVDKAVARLAVESGASVESLLREALRGMPR
jgi:Holliday junction DNA helicase RuvA